MYLSSICRGNCRSDDFFIDDLIDVDSGFRISLADKLDFFPLCFLFVRSASVTMDFIVQLYYN